MSMEQWYNDTERGNWGIGWKKIIQLNGKWMNVFGDVLEDTESGKLK